MNQYTIYISVLIKDWIFLIRILFSSKGKHNKKKSFTDNIRLYIYIYIYIYILKKKKKKKKKVKGILLHMRKLEKKNIDFLTIDCTLDITMIEVINYC